MHKPPTDCQGFMVLSSLIYVMTGFELLILMPALFW